MKPFYNLTIIVYLLIANTALAQSFETYVSAKVIGKKDILQVEYTAENVRLANFIVPNFNNWLVISGPNFRSKSEKNGNILRQQVSYSFGLLPKATGKLLIPGAVANIDGKQQKSNAVIVEIKNQDHVAGPAASPFPQLGNQFNQRPSPPEQFGNDQFLKQGESGKDKIKDNLLVKVYSNKQSCYVGEPILVTYKLYSRLKSQARVVKQPGFTGATVIEMTMNDPIPTREIINGKPYSVAIIRQVQLFPLQTGNLILPAVSVENKVSFYNAENINYRDQFYDMPSTPIEEVTLTLENKPAIIEVKPLPAKPVGYSGGIGKFDVSVALSSQTKKVETNSTCYLSVAILGAGNLKQVKSPEIKWPNGIEAFEPRETEQTDETTFPMRIRKEFVIPFVVNKPGDYTIPDISFIYFDNSQNKFVTKSARPLTFHVLQGSKTMAPVISKNSTSQAFQLRLLIILAIAFCCVIAGLFVYNKRQKKKQDLAIKQSSEIKIIDTIIENPVTYLFQIRELHPGIDGPHYYKNLFQNINAYLNAKFPDKPVDLQKVILKNPDQTELVEDVKLVLDICKQGMYTPLYSIEEAMQHRLQAIKVITRLENETFV